jgi:hypothetical protein
MRSLVFIPTLAFGLASGASADILAGGPLFAGPEQKVAVCYFYNAGSSSITLKNFRITDPGGVPVPFTVNECGPSPATLDPGKSCGVARDVVKLPYNCRVSVPDKTDVRGILELRDKDQNVLQNIELR